MVWLIAWLSRTPRLLTLNEFVRAFYKLLRSYRTQNILCSSNAFPDITSCPQLFIATSPRRKFFASVCLLSAAPQQDWAATVTGEAGSHISWFFWKHFNSPAGEWVELVGEGWGVERGLFLFIFWLKEKLQKGCSLKISAAVIRECIKYVAN